MAVSSDNPPDPASNFDLLTVDDAAERIGEFVDAVAETTETRLVALQKVIGKTRGAVKAQPFVRRFEPRVRGEVPAHQIFGAGDPQLDVESAHKPSGKTDMVRVHMGDDDALDRCTAHGSGKDLLPGLRGFVVLDAAIDDGPAVSVLEKPQIDMIELHRQAHSDPVHARPDLDRLTYFRTPLERIFELALGTSLSLGHAH